MLVEYRVLENAVDLIRIYHGDPVVNTQERDYFGPARPQRVFEKAISVTSRRTTAISDRRRRLKMQGIGNCHYPFPQSESTKIDFFNTLSETIGPVTRAATLMRNRNDFYLRTGSIHKPERVT